MAFEQFAFTKTWTSAADFPAYEPDEMQVRKDLQCLHDETKDGINRLIHALNDASAAAQIPIAAEGLQAKTVQQAVEELHKALMETSQGMIYDGSVGKGKLEADLLKRIYGGRVWVSLNAPTAADNPNMDFPVGQIWLRPAVAAENFAAGTWETAGGAAEKTGSGWVFTTDGTEDYLRAVQCPIKNGTPGHRVLIDLQLGAVSSHLEGISLHINGMETEPEEDGVYEAALDASGNLELVLQGLWPFPEEGQTMEVTSFAVLDLDALEAGFPDCEPCSDWAAVMAQLRGQEGLRLPMTLWLQTKAGVWQQIYDETLPVSHGGTGRQAVAEGALLYGGDRALEELMPADGCVLRCTGGKPVWETPQTVMDPCGYLRTYVGSYEGTGGFADRTITLPVKPLFLILWPSDETDSTACVANGGCAKKAYSYYYSGNLKNYEAKVSLRDEVLTFSNNGESNAVDTTFSFYMNEPGVTYSYIAVCGGSL